MDRNANTFILSPVICPLSGGKCQHFDEYRSVYTYIPHSFVCYLIILPTCDHNMQTAQPSACFRAS